MLRYFITFLIILITACDKTVEDKKSKKTADKYVSEKYPGGKKNTVIDVSPNAFSLPSSFLNDVQHREFFVGNSFFKQSWVAAPASTKARDGLGPTFNTRSCAGCHMKDGRGSPEFAGEFTTGLLLRLSIPGTDANGGPKGDPNYGGQLNDQAVPGVKPEGKIKVTYTESEGQFADGEKYSLRKPKYEITDLAYGPLSENIMISPRVGQHIIGMGLLEAIPEEEILKLVDVEDKNKDGISGKPNYVWDAVNQKKSLGRFGWKSNQPSVFQQTAGAFLGDLGITTSLNPNQNCPDSQQTCKDAPHGGQPELSDEGLRKTVLYVANLAVPARRNFDSPTVKKGKEVFNQLNCQACHTPSFTTGKHPDFDNLSNQEIFPYTDLLVHDMGPELADNRPDFEADGTEWRTPPLWGIGLIKTVNKHTFFMHDGRARNIQEAILWHGGEAEKSKEDFKKLSKEDREALIEFVRSL